MDTVLGLVIKGLKKLNERCITAKNNKKRFKRLMDRSNAMLSFLSGESQ